jgi:hypothetical protein
MADIVRLRKEEEEVPQGDSKKDYGYKGRGVEGEMVEGVEGEEGEKVCWAVFVTVISIILSNNTYFTSFPLLE